MPAYRSKPRRQVGDIPSLLRDRRLATSDDEGRFLIENLRGGQIYLDIVDSSWQLVGGMPSKEEIGEGVHRRDIELRVERRATLSGAVCDDEGRPLAGVRLRSVLMAPKGGDFRMNFGRHLLEVSRAAETRSLADGTFVLEGVEGRT